MSPRAARLPRWASFLGVNALAALALAALVVLPVVQRFADRRDAMAADAAETRRLDDLRRRMGLMASRLLGPGSPTLPTGDEHLGSADLQAMLQDAARSAGAGFLGVRSQPASRRADLRLVAARLDVEGQPAAIAATLRAIEDHVPLMWVTGAVLRATPGPPTAGSPATSAPMVGTSMAGTPTPGTTLRAELQVEAALAGPPAGAPRP